MSEQLLSSGEIAAEIGVHRTTILNYVRRGLITPDVVLKPTKNGRTGRHKFKRETVDAFLEQYVVGRANGERLYRTGEIARMMCTTPSVVKRWVNSGKLKPDVILPPDKNGRESVRLYSRKTVMAFSRSLYK